MKEQRDPIGARAEDAIITKTVDGIVTSWNKAAERILGYTAEEAIGRHITFIIPSDRRDEEDAILSRIKRAESIDHFHTVRARKDGGLVPLSLTIAPIKDATGRIVGASKIACDSGQLEVRGDELALHTKAELDRQRFITLADRCTEFIGMCDMDLKPFYVNEAGLRLVGLDSLDQARETKIIDFFFPEDQAPILNEFCPKVMREGRGEVEIRFRNFKNGSALWMIYNVFVIRDESGNAIALGTFSQNITDRKNAEDELRKSEAELRSLSANLEEIVASRTSELKRRNAEILVHADLLRKLSTQLLKAQDEERRRIARDLHDSAGQLIAALAMSLAGLEQHLKDEPASTKALEDAQQMVQLLNSELRTTSYLLHPPLLDESGLPQAIHWYVRGLRDRSGLHVDVQIADGFGRLPQSIELTLFRIVQESLTNVHRHSGSATATIRLSRTKREVWLQVEDQGRGLSKEKLAAINTYGSGVGVTGMRERVRQFGGTLEVTSNGAGVSVDVRLAVPDSDVNFEESENVSRSAV